MPMPPDFLCGVIEGFYGQPWSLAERGELFAWLRQCGLNAYLYGPKDDLKHRAVWRETYSPAEAEALREVVCACQGSGVQFIHAIGPGLNIRHSDPADMDALKNRFSQMLSLGCRDFALLFDDIPDRMDPADSIRFKSFASAQAFVANGLFQWLRERSPQGRFLFCPTPYCDRMADRKLGGDGYLEEIGRELAQGIDVFWTGPEIISGEIPLEHIRDIRRRLRRKPMIWDNLHANDYDGRRFFAGPYSGRPTAMLDEVAGILTNPNNEFPLNYIPVRTLADFVQCASEWRPRQAYLEALREWSKQFAVVGAPLGVEHLVALFDCYYLPHEDGETAAAFLGAVRALLSEAQPSPETLQDFQLGSQRLREACQGAVELKNRPLFHALSRRVWELREEIDLLEKFAAFKLDPANAGARFVPDSHLPKTCRGGFVPQLQALLSQRPDGSFEPTIPS